MEKIAPLLISFLIAKIIVWILEENGLWFKLENLELLFTIIGFALGIILSQKIGTTYDKYRDLESTMFKIHGELLSLSLVLNSSKKDYGTTHSKQWLSSFIEIFYGPDDGGVRNLTKANEKLYQAIYKLKSNKTIPHHRVFALLSRLFERATLVISRKASYTPQAYDGLLHQVTLIYLVLIIIFFPGFNGIISVFIGTYLLYGMYYVTKDFDMAIGIGRSSLMPLKPLGLEDFLEDLNK